MLIPGTQVVLGHLERYFLVITWILIHSGRVSKPTEIRMQWNIRIKSFFRLYLAALTFILGLLLIEP